ncbi:MAG TPA: response regulator [Candidatus Paceibacterota bacterium]
MHQPPLILTVDDQADFRDIIKARLEAAGFRVETAVDGEVGIKKAKELKPDLVLMDVKMPGINGTEAVLDMQNDPDLKDIKVVFLSNLAAPWPGVSAPNEEFAKILGAHTFIDKSKELENVAEHVKKILGVDPKKS